jgi:hypothetical protein
VLHDPDVACVFQRMDDPGAARTGGERAGGVGPNIADVGEGGGREEARARERVPPAYTRGRRILVTSKDGARPSRTACRIRPLTTPYEASGACNGARSALTRTSSNLKDFHSRAATRSRPSLFGLFPPLLLPSLRRAALGALLDVGHVPRCLQACSPDVWRSSNSVGVLAPPLSRGFPKGSRTSESVPRQRLLYGGCQIRAYLAL